MVYVLPIVLLLIVARFYCATRPSYRATTGAFSPPVLPSATLEPMASYARSTRPGDHTCDSCHAPATWFYYPADYSPDVLLQCEPCLQDCRAPGVAVWLLDGTMIHTGRALDTGYAELAY